MGNIIEVKNLSYRYTDTYVFRHVDLSVEKNKFTIVLGASGSGKTTLAKLLLGVYSSYNIVVDHIHLIKPNLAYVQTFMMGIYKDPIFIGDTVIDELLTVLNNCDDEELIVKTTMLLGINHLLKKKVKDLSDGEKQLVGLAKVLVLNPKILIIDESFSKLDAADLHKVLMLLKDMTRMNKMTVIFLTQNSEYGLYGDNVIILGDKKILITGDKKSVYERLDVFDKAQLRLPFIVNLSDKLKLYNLIDKTYLETEKLVKDLWK